MPKKKIVNVSTKSGDGGTSGLIDGVRLSKASQIFEVLGTFDELNAWIVYALVLLSKKLPEQSAALRHVQKNVYLLSALIAKADSTKVSLAKGELNTLEKNSLYLQKSMKDDWTTAFLYPGGTETAARLDIARTVCRRTERELVALSQEQQVPQIALQYVNRLSDYLYLLRCFVNFKEGYEEAQFDVE